MILTEIDHIAIAVRDLEAAIDHSQRAFGVEVQHREVVDSDGVEEALVKVADSYTQLTAATSDATPITTQIDRAPRLGGRGTTVAFVHPKGSFGTLIELVQE